ncbi:hypothetical protein FDZ74_02385 [bacterium]|nr:MAG: hypothetical protein FDZ74_02385 [bacterium]
MTDLTQIKQKHTFLQDEGVWQVTGEIFDEENQASALHGWIRVQHQVDHWLVASHLLLQEKQDQVFQNDFRVEPGDISQGAALNWTGDDAVLGELRGQFAPLDDAILSLFYSVDGRYRGSLTWLQKDATVYRLWGMLMDGGRRVAAWTMVLTRAEEAICYE